MPQPRYARPFLPLMVAALATIVSGAALGLAPYAIESMKRPELSLWDITDPLTACGIALQAVAGIVVMETTIVPLMIFPIWQQIDRAIITPRMKANAAAKNGMQWAERSCWRR